MKANNLLSALAISITLAAPTYAGSSSLTYTGVFSATTCSIVSEGTDQTVNFGEVASSDWKTSNVLGYAVFSPDASMANVKVEGCRVSEGSSENYLNLTVSATPSTLTDSTNYVTVPGFEEDAMLAPTYSHTSQSADESVYTGVNKSKRIIVNKIADNQYQFWMGGHLHSKSTQLAGSFSVPVLITVEND